MTSKKKLYIIPTPIGNLNDITLRSLDALRNSDYILCEDTRVSKRLLSKYEISTPLKSYHSFNEHKVLSSHIKSILSGKKISLISDAGTPSISDPGFLLIREAIRNDIEIDCFPGPTALIPALVNSGLPSDKFVFEGFLPVKKGRNKRLKFLSDEERSIIIYESPKRLKKLLNDLIDNFGVERKASISRELTKIYQENIRGSLKELYNQIENKNIKGEIILVVHGK